MELEVTFARDRIHFPYYHLAWLSVPDGVLPATAIRDADPAAAPPEIRTVSGQTVFVTAVQREELAQFCRSNGIPLRHRPEVWDALLEPFLDTEFPPEHQAWTLYRLAQFGLDPAEVTRIRELVGPLMLEYNALQWDWVHLGLADLLKAASTYWHRPLNKELGDFTEFYEWAMKIADLSRDFAEDADVPDPD